MSENENRSAFKHAAIYSLATVLGKMAGFLLLPLYAHVFRDLGYGIIGMMDAGLAFLATLIGYLIRGGVVRIFHEQEGERQKRAVVTTSMILMWISMGGAILLVLPFARPIAHLWLGDAGYARYLMLALLSFLFESTGGAAGVLLIIKQRSKVFSSVGLLRLFVGIGLNIWLIVGLGMGLDGYFLASVAMNAVSALVFHVLAIRECGLRYDGRAARKLIALELPLMPSNLLSFFARQAERILLRFLVTIESVGVLEMAYKFPALIALFISEPFWRSWDTKRTEIADRPGAPEQIGRMFTYYLFLVLFAALVLALDVGPLIKLMTPPEFWAAIGISEVVIVTEILNGCYYHFMFGTYYTKHTGALSLIRSVVMILKLGISFLLIRLYGLSGAAYSSAVSALILVVWTGRVSSRYYRMVLEVRRIAVLVGAALLIRTVAAEVDLVGVLGLRGLDRTLTPRLVAMVQGTFLAGWRDGLALRLLQQKSLLVYELGARTLLASLFLLLIPVVHVGARRRLLALLPARAARRRPLVGAAGGRAGEIAEASGGQPPEEP